MKYFQLFCAFILVIFIACTPEKEETGYDLNILQGTWKLTKYIDHGSGATEWSSYSDNVIYLKHVTPSHFTWVRFEINEDNMAGTGGGTYSFDGSIYTEDIQFFHPPGSSELGQAIPFTVEIKDGMWYHTGYAKQTEFDPELGEVVVVDSNKIEEIWNRVDEPGVGSSADLMGTWELVRYKDSDDSIYSEYPPFISYVKHITPTHFIWINYNAEGDEVISEGGGTYSIKDGSYIEHVEFRFPPGERMRGVSLPFTYSIENGNWFHRGFMRRMGEGGESAIEIDSSQIDEIWRKAVSPQSTNTEAGM